jgi:2-polyprenyl-6-methoxyphenol hydroxylase-like FAD-dependent oxidoreductase
MAALALREQGVDVRVVERQSELSTHSFPVVLHPQTLRLLSELGLAPTLFWRGRPITRLAIYANHERRAVLDLPKVNGIAPGLLTLPRDVLRQALLRALERRGVEVTWRTHLVDFEQDGHGVRGRLRRELGAEAPEVTIHFDADYVIGADGYDSTVRDLLGIQLVAYGDLSSFAFFDAPSQRAGLEAQLAISDDFANAVYPLQGGLARFSFQLGKSLSHPPDLALLRELLGARLPWYNESIDAYQWGGVAEFRRALADRLGRGRVWLVGEAAHLTAPLGVHSLNVGIDEAYELGQLMAANLRAPSSAHFGPDYEARRLGQWRELLGVEEQSALNARSPEWARRHLHTLYPSLPASGADLDELLSQLRLTPTSARPERASDAAPDHAIKHAPAD